MTKTTAALRLFGLGIPIALSACGGDDATVRNGVTRLSGTRVSYDSTQWPTAQTALSSPFGPRLKASENFRYDFHRGIDIPGAIGDPIVAIADGEVFRVYLEGDPNSPFPSGGNTVILRHTLDQPFPLHGMAHSQYYSLYLHLDSIAVSANTSVAKGDSIGTMGQSGTTTFTHLHFETRVGTTCSREFQIANPGAACASYFAGGPQDPHVNPLMFLDYPNVEGLAVEVLQASPLRLRVHGPRDELDFNDVRVYAGNVEKRVDINSRIGIDPANIDNPDYDGVTIGPARFSTESSEYEMQFEFTELSGYDAIEARDVWGAGLRLER